MSGRQVFSESEKLCLQELIIKYKINSTATIAAGNPASKKMAWARLVEEYNSIESNCKRTESQLKKCWDNLKTRKKALLAGEKKERMRTGGGQFHPTPGPSHEDHVMLVDDALLEQTDVELQYVIDSDNMPLDSTQESLCIEPAASAGSQNDPLASQTYTEADTIPEPDRDNRGRSGSRFTDYSASGSQTPGGGAKNIRAKVIAEEFHIRKINYEKLHEREEELHHLNVAEKEWLVKAAEESYKKAQVERKSAEEVLRYNQLKREEAELLLEIKNRNK